MYKGEEEVLEIISKKKTLSVSQISEISRMKEDSIRRIVESLKTAGILTTEATEEHKAEPTEELLKYLSEFKNIWHCLPKDIAKRFSQCNVHRTNTNN